MLLIVVFYQNFPDFIHLINKLRRVTDEETAASESVLVLVVQASLHSVVDVLSHVLAVPVPVDLPSAGLSGSNGAAGADQVGATVSDVRGEVDGLVQLLLVRAAEHQTSTGVEVGDAVGCGREMRSNKMSRFCSAYSTYGQRSPLRTRCSQCWSGCSRWRRICLIRHAGACDRAALQVGGINKTVIES